MPELRDVVAQWFKKADHDLSAAEVLLAANDACLTETVCFHAQQCIEKSLKAVPKIHDIRVLWRLIPDGERPDLPLATARRVTEYAATMRYPGDDADIGLDEAGAAVALARRTRGWAAEVLAPLSLH
jgi:HEPN domain-containing protein